MEQRARKGVGMVVVAAAAMRATAHGNVMLRCE